MAIVIGAGLALSPIHNRWLTDVVTSNGKVEFFIPAFGYAIWILATSMFLVWEVDWKEFDWGSRIVLVPLIVIVISIGISGIVNADTLVDKLTPLLMGVFFLSLYLASRNLGSTIFRPFVPLVIIVATSTVIGGLLIPGESTGGLITNYCASAGFLIFGSAINHGRWQWVLLTVMLVGVFFIGALEAVFILTVLGIVVVVRWDVSCRLAVASGILVALVGTWIALGLLTPLYEGNRNLVALFGLLSGSAPPTSDIMAVLLTGRWQVAVNALRSVSIVGHGFVLSPISGINTVHNLPLIIMHQIGPLAAVAWSFVTVYCLVKTKWKYAWISLIAMCVFDHYIWTQFAPYWWALTGVSLTSKIESDKIFSRTEAPHGDLPGHRQDISRDGKQS